MLWFFVILALILLWAIPAFRTLQEREGQSAPRWRIPFLHLIDEPEEAAVVFILLGIGIAVGGYAFLYGLGTLRDMVGDFYANIAAEAISIAITVLIIERLYERRSKAEAEKAEKERLILQMGSPDNGFAVEAVRQLEKKGWLKDGTLRGANLSRADLSGISVLGVNLSRADLGGANLAGAMLWDANLDGASLRSAKLYDANLWGASLRWADLHDANLNGAVLWGANFDKANLRGTDFGKADLGGASFKRAIYTKHDSYSNETIWPEGFEPKAAGAIEVKWNDESQRWQPVGELERIADATPAG